MKSFLSLACSAFIIACSGSPPQTNSSANSTSPNTAAANSTGNREYPRSTFDAFLGSCEKAGSSGAFCTCVFEKVQAKYTFEEFSVIESELVAGTPPEDFVEFTGNAWAECTK